MSSYETAPATKMLATACACCARPLVDAVSVETGIGPDCRAKHGYASAQGAADWTAVAVALEGIVSAEQIAAWENDAHRAANALVHRVAVAQNGTACDRLVAAISALGFTKLAARIAKRLGALTVSTEGETLLVAVPFSPEFNERARTIPGQRWDSARKVRTVPASSRRALWTVLLEVFPGYLLNTSRGTVTIG